MPQDPIVETADVRVDYDGHTAVDGVSLTVQEGELVGVLGTNGAGKTSFLECVEGLRRPSGGRVRVFGLDPFVDRTRVRTHTGIMLQEGGFARDLTVRETIRMWTGVTSGAAPMGDALAALDLASRADVLVKQLSGGERRRLDVVLATITRPRLLFLDEPTTGLDLQSRHAAWELVEALRREGTTILLTTHQLEEAEKLADRLVILHRGRIEVEGTLAHISSGVETTISYSLNGSPRGPDRLSRGAEVAGNRLRIRTSNLQRDLYELLVWAEGEGVALEDLRATTPTLEDVFTAILRRAGDDPEPAT